MRGLHLYYCYCLFFSHVFVFQLVLVSPSGDQYDSLLRQLRERMDEGCGETIYVVGMGSGEAGNFSPAIFPLPWGHRNGLLMDGMFNSHSKGSGFEYNVFRLPVVVLGPDSTLPLPHLFLTHYCTSLWLKYSAECSMKPWPLHAYMYLWC